MQYNLIHQSRLQVAMKENIQIFFSDERSPITKLIKSSYRGDKSLFLYPLRNNGKYQDISFTWGAKTCFLRLFAPYSLTVGVPHTNYHLWLIFLQRSPKFSKDTSV